MSATVRTKGTQHSFKVFRALFRPKIKLKENHEQYWWKNPKLQMGSLNLETLYPRTVSVLTMISRVTEIFISLAVLSDLLLLFSSSCQGKNCYKCIATSSLLPKAVSIHRFSTKKKFKRRRQFRSLDCLYLKANAVIKLRLEQELWQIRRTRINSVIQDCFFMNVNDWELAKCLSWIQNYWVQNS